MTISKASIPSIHNPTCPGWGPSARGEGIPKDSIEPMAMYHIAFDIEGGIFSEAIDSCFVGTSTPITPPMGFYNSGTGVIKVHNQEKTDRTLCELFKGILGGVFRVARELFLEGCDRIEAITRGRFLPIMERQ